MTDKQQDNILLEDILIRNYFNSFKNSQNKTFNLSFFYNNIYTNKNIIPNYENFELKNNEQKIYQNFDLFLNWYNLNNFIADINIHDNLLLKNIEFCVKIFHLLFTKLSNTQVNFYITISQNDNLNTLINKLKYLQTFNINFIFNIASSQIKNFINYDFSFINYKINILISPQDSGEQLIYMQQLINKYNLIINEYIEIDSDEWTEQTIKEYLKYLQYLLINNESIENLFKTNLPISLKDQHILDNTNCKKNCAFQKSLNILLINLSINLCHKFQYDDLTIGYLIPETNKIFSFQAQNLPTSMLGIHLKRSSTPHCERCPFINLCQGFCFHQSYLKCYNPIIPIQESCKLKKAKFTFIFTYLLKNTNFVQEINESINLNDLNKYYLNQIIKNLQEGFYENK